MSQLSTLPPNWTPPEFIEALSTSEELCTFIDAIRTKEPGEALDPFLMEAFWVDMLSTRQLIEAVGTYQHKHQISGLEQRQINVFGDEICQLERSRYLGLTLVDADDLLQQTKDYMSLFIDLVKRFDLFVAQPVDATDYSSFDIAEVEKYSCTARNALFEPQKAVDATDLGGDYIWESADLGDEVDLLEFHLYPDPYVYTNGLSVAVFSWENVGDSDCDLDLACFVPSFSSNIYSI